MKRSGDIDELVRAYYGLQGRSTQGLFTPGRVYGERCTALRCGSDTRSWREEAGRWVCLRCGADWPYDDVVVAAGEVQESGQPGAYEERLIGLIDVGYVLNSLLRKRTQEGQVNLWRWSAQALVAWCVTVATLEEIAQHATTYGWRTTTGRTDWTTNVVHAAINSVRVEIRRRMRQMNGSRSIPTPGPAHPVARRRQERQRPGVGADRAAQ